MKTLYIAIAVLTMLPACATLKDPDYAARVNVWVARDLSKKAVGENPIGNVLVTQPLPFYASLYFQHVSSIDGPDPGEMNQVGVGFCVKIPAKKCN